MRTENAQDAVPASGSAEPAPSQSPHEPQRQAGYAAAMATFGSAAVLAGWAARRTGRVPEGYAARDLVLGALATHKFARIIAKEGVATPLRAPFTVFEGEAGAAEVDERPREGHRHTVGELLLCPFCLGPWVGGAYVAGLALAPGAARAWAATFSIVGVSDFLQHAYARLRAD
ncbi:DUF1360 domain-containing protein [Nocardioides sp. zg-DK7169]|uniref:DUF1360 domain-containing protein n=1 Tax=Nocardioides sp. zg-DK7169 TaxID=2736600 RepID=UPI0015553700|nr:DUF1360 domain-containing protein [Nocardioides sp. zg-DK7169]NPC96828.1 DUF1360 domain-containing protein [Nocardioides sp. zg-DK7169]